MATVIFKQTWGAVGSQITVTLDALAANGFRQSDEVDNSSLFFLDAQVMLRVATTATAISSSGTVEIYGFGQVGQATAFRTDTMGALDAAAVNVANARLIAVMQANSGNTVYVGGPYSVANAFGGLLPYKWGIIIANKTGAQLTNSGNLNQLFFIGNMGQGV